MIFYTLFILGATPVNELFHNWDTMLVRLDIYHYIRRIASGVTTDAHQLYGVFMGRLSECIFVWDAEDMLNLRRAKLSQLEGQGVKGLKLEVKVLIIK
jgi:hypothetical protein